jgi:CD109 antigen
VLAPFLIRPGKPFNVGIRRWGATKELKITLTISGTRQDGSVITPIVSKATISCLSTGTFISLNAGTLPKGNYFLTVEGDGYTDKRALTYATKTSSIVVQLNKSIFSPGQIVQFRLFSYNSETNAVTPSDKCIVTINDSDGNDIETFQGFDFKKGKVEREFKLASRPPLGLWTLIAQCGSEVSILK